jgi:hypothetical protein
MSVQYPEIKVKLTGKDGNAYAILGATIRALRAAKLPDSEIDRYQAEAMAGDYNHLLAVTMDWVDVS